MGVVVDFRFQFLGYNTAKIGPDWDSSRYNFTTETSRYDMEDKDLNILFNCLTTILTELYLVQDD